MEDPFGWLASLERVPEGGQGQAGVQRRRAGPADDAPAPGIEDGGQEQPAFRRFEVRDVGSPGLVGAARGRAVRDDVRGDRLGMAAVRGPGPTPVLLLAAEPLRAHQPGAAALARAGPFLAQILDDAWGSVCAAAGAVGGGDLCGERRILALPFVRPLLPPAVVATGRHAQQLAEQAHAMLALHRLDLGIPLPGVSERMPSDFFSAVSRSRMRNSSARRSAISSSACARVRGTGALDPVRAAYSLRHSYSAPTGRPSSSATALTIRSPRSVSSTAWRLYVSSYWRRGVAAAPLCSALFMRSFPPHRIGVRPRPTLLGRSLRQAIAPVLGSAQPAYPACPLNRGNLTGSVEVDDIGGCEFRRIRDLPLFPDVVHSPHLVGRNPAKCPPKIFFLKRYVHGENEPRAKVAVMHLVNDKLRPASFYSLTLTPKWLNQNAPEILWKKNEG